MTEEPIAVQIAELATGLRYEALPHEVVAEARRRLLDALGCIVAGVHGEAVEKIREAVRAIGGNDQATAVGERRRTSIDKAALVNCSALRQLDYMDGHPGPYPGHACFNIPPVLATAELAESTGRNVIVGMALGYEMNIRLQMGAGDPDITSHGFGPASNLGISSAVAMAKMLGLTADQMANAIGIAASHSATLDASSRDQLPESKTCADGVAAASSAIAVLMARAGLTGPMRVFESEGGYQKAIARRLDTDILLAPLERFRIMEVYTKRYNAVKCAQTAAPAALDIASRLPHGWRDIETLRIGFPERDYQQQSKDADSRRRPETRDTANHSAVYCVAAALVDGDLGPRQFEPDRLHDADILALIDRIELEPRPELNQYWPAANPTQATAVAMSGETLDKLVIYSPGHSQNPLSDAELQTKFRGLCAGKLGPSDIDHIIELCSRLDQLDTIRPLMDIIANAGVGESLVTS
ncbi:MAG: MmgE/PrpD family protein [Chloroflexi bacterium]|nr:MmgE/PrpD family protein [Chloroflexota bacterium]